MCTIDICIQHPRSTLSRCRQDKFFCASSWLEMAARVTSSQLRTGNHSLCRRRNKALTSHCNRQSDSYHSSIMVFVHGTLIAMNFTRLFPAKAVVQKSNLGNAVSTMSPHVDKNAAQETYINVQMTTRTCYARARPQKNHCDWKTFPQSDPSWSIISALNENVRGR